MTPRFWKFIAVSATTALAIVACKTTQPPAPSSAGEVSAGTPTPSAGSGGGGGGTSIPTLVNVNLQNVLNDLSVSLKVNRAPSHIRNVAKPRPGVVSKQDRALPITFRRPHKLRHLRRGERPFFL